MEPQNTNFQNNPIPDNNTPQFQPNPNIISPDNSAAHIAQPPVNPTAPINPPVFNSPAVQPVVSIPATNVGITDMNNVNQPPQQPIGGNTSDINADYHSNPFSATLVGLKQIIEFNGINGLLLTLLSFVITSIAFGAFFVVFIFLAILGPLAVIFIIPIFIAVLYFFGAIMASYYYLYLASSHGETKSASELIKAGFKKGFNFLLLIVLSDIIVTIGLILLLVPGLILLGRISLAPIIMLDENLGPVEAIKRSISLTKGHLFEMYSAMFSGSLLCGYGLLLGLVIPASLGIRYTEIKRLNETNSPKPKMHWINWLVPVSFAFFVAMYILLIAVGVLSANLKGKVTNPTSTSTSSQNTNQTIQFNSN